MHSNFSKSQKEFYEEYWKKRKVDEHLHTADGMWIPERIEVAVNMIVNNLSLNEGKHIYVLDIGCGEGTLGKILKERLGEKVFIIGCDISDTILKEASAYYHKISQVDLETEGLMQKCDQYKYDYIIILEVLEHLLNPENIVRQCHSLLKEDGTLIASFPNIAWYRYRIDMLRGYFPKDYLLFPGEHIQHFNFFSFNAMLRKSGFSPTKIDGKFIFPRIFKPARLFLPIVKRFPNLFGYQIVVKYKKM